MRESNALDEVLDRKAYRQLMRENKDKEGYILEISKRVRMKAAGQVGVPPLNCVAISIDKAKHYGLEDLDGFFILGPNN